MQYAAFLYMIASALAAKSIGIVTIHSGSEYQYASLVVSGDSVGVGSGTDLQLVLNDDGSLAEKISKKYLNAKDGGEVSLTSTAQKEFAIKDGALTFSGKETFVVCSGKLANGNACSDSVGVRLKIASESDTENYYPGTTTSTTKSSSSTKAASTSSTKAASATAASASIATDGTITAGKKFGLIAIHSGSDVQNAAIKQVADHPHVFSVGGSDGSDLTVSFDDDKTSLADSNGRGVNVDSSTGEIGSVAPFGRVAATTGFSISESGDLTFDNAETFYACPSGNGYSLTDKSCEGGIGIALKVVYA